jgi:hypothetical protein
LPVWVSLFSRKSEKQAVFITPGRFWQAEYGCRDPVSMVKAGPDQRDPKAAQNFVCPPSFVESACRWMRCSV